jgi:ABC-type antimicrobial peptide transport system permease subunit
MVESMKPDALFRSLFLVALLMTVAGSLWPALRALRMDPVTAIRAE